MRLRSILAFTSLAATASAIGQPQTLSPNDAFVVVPPATGDRASAPTTIASIADLDDDNIEDLIISCAGCPAVRIVRGANGALLAHIAPTGDSSASLFGSVVGSAGDLDADGLADALVMDRAASATGDDRWRLHAYTITTPETRLGGPDSIIWTAERPTRAAPLRILTLPDVNADGVNDIAVGGATRADAAAPFGETGVVTVLSGADGALLWEVFLPGTRLGAGLERIPDLDGDGFDDIAAGAPGGAGFGPILLISSAGGNEIARIDHQGSPAGFGFDIARIADLNADGVDDIAVGDPLFDFDSPRTGRVTAHALPSGEPLRTWTAPALHSAQFGRTVSNLGDIDGDGQLDFGAADPAVVVGEQATQTPAAYIYSGASQFHRIRLVGVGASGFASALAPSSDALDAVSIVVGGSADESAAYVFLPNPVCPADATRDGVVDGADLGALLTDWGRPSRVNPRIDLDADGVISAGDLGLMLGAWGVCD